MNEDTPPTGTAIPRPPQVTLRAIAESSEATLSLVREMHRRVMAESPAPASIRVHVPPLPTPPELIPPPSSARPSVAARAMQGAVSGATKNAPKIGRWLIVASGALGWAAQGVAMLSKPEYGPLVQALRVIAAALAGTDLAPPGPQ